MCDVGFYVSRNESDISGFISINVANTQTRCVASERFFHRREFAKRKLRIAAKVLVLR